MFLYSLVVSGRITFGFDGDDLETHLYHAILRRSRLTVYCHHLKVLEDTATSASLSLAP